MRRLLNLIKKSICHTLLFFQQEVGYEFGSPLLRHKGRGIPVLPGDIIVGDINGVVVIPPELADDIAQGALKKLSYEEKRAKEIENGVFVKPDIDEKLRQLGVLP